MLPPYFPILLFFTYFASLFWFRFIYFSHHKSLLIDHFLVYSYNLKVTVLLEYLNLSMNIHIERS